MSGAIAGPRNFEEGMAAVEALLVNEKTTFEGKFHRFRNIASLPRPVQRPRPPFWIAAFSTEESFRTAGENGHDIMAIPLSGAAMAPLIRTYREAWQGAGHPGKGRVMVAFHRYCAPTDEGAFTTAEPLVNAYLHSLHEAASDWGHLTSKDYPNDDKLIEGLRTSDFRKQVEQNAVLVGTPETIGKTLRSFLAEVGGFDVSPLQVNFHTLAETDAQRSVRLFAREVMPKFQ